MREKVREEGFSEVAVRLGSHLDCRAGSTSKVTAQIHLSVIGTHPSVKNTKQSRNVNSARSVRSCTGRLRNNQAKSRKTDDNSAVALLKDRRQMGCVFQDAEPPKFSSILRKSTKVLRPIKRVRFTKAALCHVNIREKKGPSVEKICPFDPCERSPYAPQFEDRSQEETERDKSDALAETRGDWRRVSISSKRKKKLRFSHLPKFGVSQRHLKQNRRKDNLLLLPEHPCTC